MPVIWEARDGVIVVSTIGDYQTSELLDAVDEAVRKAPGSPVLFDSRSALAYLSAHELRRRCEWLARLHRQGLIGRCAVFMSRDPYRVQIAQRTAENLREFGVATMVFTERDDAMRWLKASSDRDLSAAP